MSDNDDDKILELIQASKSIGLWSTYAYPNRANQKVVLLWGKRWFKATVLMFDPDEDVCMHVRWGDRSETRYPRADVLDMINLRHIRLVTFYV